MNQIQQRTSTTTKKHRIETHPGFTDSFNLNSFLQNHQFKEKELQGISVFQTKPNPPTKSQLFCLNFKRIDSHKKDEKKNSLILKGCYFSERSHSIKS